MDHAWVPEPEGFSELSTIEQIRYVQALWDRVVDSGCEIPVPEGALELVEERLAEYRRDPGASWLRLQRVGSARSAKRVRIFDVGLR